jgi:hypothetical protein
MSFTGLIIASSRKLPESPRDLVAGQEKLDVFRGLIGIEADRADTRHAYALLQCRRLTTSPHRSINATSEFAHDLLMYQHASMEKIRGFASKYHVELAVRYGRSRAVGEEMMKAPHTPAALSNACCTWRSGAQADRQRHCFVVVEHQRWQRGACGELIAALQPTLRFDRVAQLAQAINVTAQRPWRHLQALRQLRARPVAVRLQ